MFFLFRVCCVCLRLVIPGHTVSEMTNLLSFFIRLPCGLAWSQNMIDDDDVQNVKHWDKLPHEQIRDQNTLCSLHVQQSGISVGSDDTV